MYKFGMFTEYERPDVRSKIVKPRTSFVENFYKLLKRETETPYNIKKVDFNVKDETTDSDGTKHITIYPIKVEEASDIKAKGFYLISSEDKDEAYLLEFCDPNRYGDPEYFVGINSVRNPKSVENKDEWVREVLKNRVSYIFQNQSLQVLSSVGILQDSGDDLSIVLYGYDSNLIKFFESITT